MIRRLELRVAGLERQAGMDSGNSSVPPSKDSLAAKARQKAARRASQRERSGKRKPGGQPGHPGSGLKPEPNPDRTERANPPAECRSCGAGLADGAPAGTGWGQVWDIPPVRLEKMHWLLPKLRCAACGTVTTADPPGGRAGTVVYMPSRSSEAIKNLGVLDGYQGILVRDDYAGWAQFDGQLAGVQQCCQHIFRHLNGVHALHPGWQHWAEEVRQVLTQAHAAVQDAVTAGHDALGPELLADLRERYDSAVAWGETTNRLRDWDNGKNHPGYVLARRLKAKASQIWLFTGNFAVPWTNNASEQAIRGPKRHQAVSGYWHSLATLGRYCRVRSYLTTSRNHGMRPIDAIHAALAGRPWLPTSLSA